jgi:hypothetical protein
MVFMQLGLLEVQAAPNDVNLTMEYRYNEGNSPTIPRTVTRAGREYRFLSQTEPVLAAKLPITRTYVYKIDGLLTDEDLKELSKIDGLVVTPVSIAFKREVDKPYTLKNQKTNDVDALPAQMPFEVTSAYDPSGIATVVLSRAGISFEVEGYRRGLPTSYQADLVYRGLETYNGVGYYEAADTYQNDVQIGDVNQYVVVVTYEPVVTTTPVYEGGGTPIVDNNNDGSDDDTGIPISNNPTTGNGANAGDTSGTGDTGGSEQTPPDTNESGSDTVNIEDPEPPTAGPDDEIIVDPPVDPIKNDGNWALFNLLFIIIGLVLAVVLLVAAIGAMSGGASYTQKTILAILTLLLALTNTIIFTATENMRLPMNMVDGWTALTAVILLAEVVVAIVFMRAISTEKAERDISAS